MTFSLHDGAAVGGGAPRVFAKVDGTYVSALGTVDVPGGDTGGATLILPAGTITHFGLVYDNGVAGRVAVDAPRFVSADGSKEITVLFAEQFRNFGEEVSTYVKAHGGPPPHANAKVNR
jgi:hypothetical protein